MQVTCANCTRKLTLPKNKIPIGKPFKFACPSCSFKNTTLISEDGTVQNLEPPQSPEVAESVAQEAVSRPCPPKTEAMTTADAMAAANAAFQAPTTPVYSDPLYDTASLSADLGLLEELISSNMDNFSGGLQEAIVVYDNEEITSKIVETVTELGFHPEVALNVRDAVRLLKFKKVSLVIIQEDYYGATVASNQVLRAIQTLDMQTLRTTFVAVIGKNFTTLDDLHAFSLSVDTVINLNDLEDFKKILISSLEHHKKFYKVYLDILEMRDTNF